jgi:phospholipid/cholesterol/gamma-HCH transport system ATP-binding protein
LEKILFLKDGLKAWEGNKEEIFRTDNEAGTFILHD